MTFVLVKDSYFWQTYFEGLTVLLNIVLSVDLILTLYQPFSNPMKRYPCYLGFALTLPIGPAICRMIYFDTDGYSYGKIEGVFFVVEIFASLVSIIYSIFFLCKPGTSKRVLK